MSLFGKWFGTSGGGKGGKGPTPQEAVQKLRETEEMLAKKQEFLEKKIEQEIMTAKKHGMKNQRAALQALKRKKRYSKQLEQIDGTLSTIEFQREALENANTNTEVLKNMGFAAKAMKAAHKELNVDSVDDLMSDIMEQQELAQEITDVISNPISFGDQVDEDELMAELEELEQEELDRNLLDVEGMANVNLPSVPSVLLPSRPVFFVAFQPRRKMMTAWTWPNCRPGPPTKLKWMRGGGGQGTAWAPLRHHPPTSWRAATLKCAFMPDPVVHPLQVEACNVNNQCTHTTTMPPLKIFVLLLFLKKRQNEKKKKRHLGEDGGYRKHVPS
ncbi:charged multivesicular body protein 4b-like isoform X1 [Syngnathus typhle]|uniref:charged multivesicular body protein 4b-like isoform X1 n=1 Tax=Syngnathus typhle TaxID=161592 RepID=UPI002A6B45E6|nr:charged multivesicular body protein 4b-like isoform X1 [Syngnathus typhle]